MSSLHLFETPNHLTDMNTNVFSNVISFSGLQDYKGIYFFDDKCPLLNVLFGPIS